MHLRFDRISLALVANLIPYKLQPISICRDPKKSPDICIKMRRWYSKITRYIIPHSFSKLPLTPNHLKTIFLNLAVGASGWVLVGIPEYSHLFPPTYLLPPTSKNYFLNSSHPHPMAKKTFSWGYILRKAKIDVPENMFGKTFCFDVYW